MQLHRGREVVRADLEVVKVAWNIVVGPAIVKQLGTCVVLAWPDLVLEHYEHTLQPHTTRSMFTTCPV